MKFAKFFGSGAAVAVLVIGSASVAMSGGTPGATTAAEVVAAEGAYKVDPVHSSIVFRVKHMNVAPFYGRFNKVEGSFELDPSDAAKNAVDITIAADSVDTNNAGRDKHLKSQDFFSASEFATINFKSKAWKPTTRIDGEQLYDVVGDLTLLGKTREVTVQVRHTGSGEGRGGSEVAGLEGKIEIKRSDFGMDFMVGKGLSDEVTIMVGIEGGRQ